MKVKALKPWSNGEISMEQYEVRDLPDVLAQNLIDAGIVVEIGGGSGGGALIVTATAGTLDKTWQEIVDAMSTTGAVLAHYVDGSIDNLVTFKNANGDDSFGEYTVSTGSGVTETYMASSASGYPVRQSE